MSAPSAPAIAASREAGVESFFFMADYHALIKCDEPERINRSRLEIAAVWLAAGLDTSRVTFYRQSDIPEIPELTWLLTCITSKGQMNRAHAYKGAVDANLAAGEDPDAGITMGLYSYPILMAADILIFNAHRVPVGKDQVQHIEMARDVAQRFNHQFGRNTEFFVLPEANVEEDVALLPGLDGRKMSKSYDNSIPLFEGGSKGLKEAIARIVTDSRLPGEPKEPEGQALVTIYDAFATPQQRADFRAALRAGLAWGEAKQQLFELIEAEIAPMRARYDALMAHPERIEEILQQGAEKGPRHRRPAAGPSPRGRGPAPLHRRGCARSRHRQGRQGRPAGVQAIPRGRRPVLLQAGQRRGSSLAAKRRLRRRPRRRPVGEPPQARRHSCAGRGPGAARRGCR